MTGSHPQTSVRERTDRGEAGAGPFGDRLPEHLLESIPDAVVAVAGDGAILLVNRESERIFGYRRDELIGEPVEMLVPARHRDEHFAQRQRYFEEPTTRGLGTGLEFHGLRRNGSEFPLDMAVSPIGTGEGTTAIVVVHDLSEAKESERRRDEELARANREARIAQSRRLESLGQLAGGVAHDFNNLLGVILNYADFVADELEQGTTAHTDVVEIRKAAERATDLTRQLLIFSRREITKPAPVHLNEVVRDIERLLGRTLGEQVELVVDLSRDVPAVLADPGQVEQVLVNLAVNARDAMPDGGRLVIETSEVELDRDFLQEHPDVSPGRYVRLTVADNGTGMEPDVAARVFEPFFSTKHKGEGTGLGLATVYGIVTAAGGQISLYSEPGEGTVFRVHLPAVDSEAAAAPGQIAVDFTGRGESVLLVEDDDTVRALAKRILTEGGYLVTPADRGAEAVRLLEDPRRDYDLLISDVVMPGMRGVELAQRARQLRPELPVLMMSGYTSPMAPEDRRALAEAPLLEKPFSRRDLLGEVRSLLDERRVG
ncbi:MAG TPA: ATP-binding protein [Solirubrobacterales bacterium]